MRAFLGFWFDLVFEERENVEPRIFGWLFVAGDGHSRLGVPFGLCIDSLMGDSYPCIICCTHRPLGPSGTDAPLNNFLVCTSVLLASKDLCQSTDLTGRPSMIQDTSFQHDIVKVFFASKNTSAHRWGPGGEASFIVCPHLVPSDRLGRHSLTCCLLSSVTKWVVALPGGALTAHIVLIISRWIAYHTLSCVVWQAACWLFVY